MPSRRIRAGEFTSARRLVALPLRAAAAVRWDRGRALFGPDWHGGEPLHELYEELADAFNYLAEDARRHGERAWHGAARRSLGDLAGVVRRVVLARERRVAPG